MAGLESKRRKVERFNYDLKINILNEKNINSLSEAFCKKEIKEIDKDVEVIHDPFTCCVLSNFIQPWNYLTELKRELTGLDLEDKVNDLYQFKQSKDLGDSSLPHISRFKKLLKEKVLGWMKDITKIPLTDKIDIFCSHYSITDHLLCHDDELEGRRVAYIFYLVPEWREEDGGLLDLFDTVEGQPSEIRKSILPKWNSFAFFEVSPVSFHQVSEVLSSKDRIALSGWFYGPPLKPSTPLKETLLLKDPDQQEIDITEWINPIYLDGQALVDIRETFEDSSEISLPDFLQTKKYEEVCKALLDNKITWKNRGPANYRNVNEAHIDENTPAIVKECQLVFESEALLLVLSNLTGLKLHPMCEGGGKTGKVFSCVRKWSPGSYSLLHDQSFSRVKSLNAVLYFNCEDWDSEYGGYSSFVAMDDNEELLRLEPCVNSLALVYVTEDTSHFVKYISKAIKNSPSFFHDIHCIYVDENEDDENDDDDE